MDGTDTESSPSSLLAWVRGSAAARDTALVLGAQGLTTLIALGVDSLLFRTLPMGERGMLTAGLALQAVFLILCDMGISLTTVRVGAKYWAQGLEAEANLVFRRALLTRLLLAAGISALAFFLSPALVRCPLAAGKRLELVWAAAAALMGTTIILWGVDVAQSRRRFGHYFALQMIAAVMRAWIIVLVLKKMTLDFEEKPAFLAEPLLWSIAAASCLTAFLCVMLNRDALKMPQNMSPEKKRSIDEELHAFGRYAAALALLGGLEGYVALFLIQYRLKPEDTAVYDGARRLVMVLPMLTTALATVLLPRAAALESVEACRAYVKKALKFSVPLAVVSAGGLAAAASVLVPLFWSDKYVPSVPVLHWLCLAYAFNVLLNPLALVLFPLRRERTLVWLNGAGILLSIVAGLALIPRYGAVGAAWSVLAVKVIVMLACGAVLVSALRKKDHHGDTEARRTE